MSVQPLRAWRPMVARDPAERHRASTPLELFFDLCFVVAVSQAAAQLEHDLAGGHIAAGVLGYAMVFFAIWWGWVNFTWFASAYDTDDVPYRLLTLLQIAGVLVLAAGVPAALQSYDFRTITAGYVVMRVAMIAQWARCATSHPAGRAAALRYAVGIAICQVGWVARLALPHPADYVGFAVMVAAELAVPVWAEFRGARTSWHPGHIAERYGLFTLIVLGEAVAASTVAVQSAITTHGLSTSLLVIAGGALLLVFGVWWSYFKHEVAEGLRASLASTFAWAHSHYAILAAIAAVGAGIEVAAETAEHATKVSSTTAALIVAVPVVVYLVVGGQLHGRLSDDPFLGQPYNVAAAVVVLLAAAATPLLGLPGAVVAMGAIVAALVAGNLVRAHRAGVRADARR